MLQLKNLSKKKGNQTLFQDLSLSLEKGSTHLFLGASGVGKSTLLRTVAGLEPLDDGAILFDGVEIQADVPSKRPIGMIFQEYHLFSHLSLLENLILPLKCLKISLPEKKALSLLETYSIADKKHHYPNQLSGGQKQRAAIARAMALDPPILCMDEPTAALDPYHTAQVAEQIAKLQSLGKIILISTHDLKLLDILDAKAHLLEGGQLQSVTNAFTA